MKKIFFILLIYYQDGVSADSTDYWTDSFDENQSCKDKIVIEKLSSKKDGKFCNSVPVSKMLF